MNKKALFLPLLLLFSIASAQTLERYVLGSTGGTGTAGQVLMTFTVGEAVSGTLQAGAFILTQGFQQPDGGSKVSIEKPWEVTWQVYPNPTRDWVALKLSSDRNTVLHAAIFDIEGKNTGQAPQLAHFPGEALLRFDLSRLAAGMYLIRLSDDTGKEAHTLRIQKTN